jgi:hypothetical protein
VSFEIFAKIEISKCFKVRNILMAHVDIYLFRRITNIVSEVTRQAQYVTLYYWAPRYG